MAVDLRRYRDPVEGPVRFIADQIALPDGRTVGRAMVADPWVDRDVLRPIFAVDADGLPLHRLVYDELPRGHWKSGAGAAVAVAEAILRPSTDVVIAAGDRDQAAIVADHIAGYLARNPALGGSFVPKVDTFVIPARDSRIRVISSDAPTSWGLGGIKRRFRVIADELTMWRSDDLWVSLSSSTGKVADAQTIILSNAGFDPDGSWQWRVREVARTEPWGHLFSATGPIASWISPEWIAQMRTLLPAAAFERVIENRWTSGIGDFVTADQWRRCIEPGLKPQGTGQPGVRYHGGLDLGLTKDRTALAVVHRDGDQIVLDDLMVWEPPVEVETIERATLDVARRFRGVRLQADPWELRGSIPRLQRLGANVREFKFSSGSVQRLSQTLYEAITSARLRAFDDRDLEREVTGLRVIQTSGGWRVDHRAGGFSDRAMALGMALVGAAEVRDRPIVRLALSAGRRAGGSPWRTAGVSGRWSGGGSA